MVPCTDDVLTLSICRSDNSMNERLNNTINAIYIIVLSFFVKKVYFAKCKYKMSA